DVSRYNKILEILVSGLYNRCQCIDIKKLRAECILGCPENAGIRALVWKLLLNYLPPNASKWDVVSSKARAEYSSFLSEFIEKKFESTEIVDHPLSCDPESNWREYFDDNKVLLQINKDCRRLYPELDFFRRPTQFPLTAAVSSSLSVSSLRNRVETALTPCDQSLEEKRGDAAFHGDELLPHFEAHWEVVQRIIFVYYKVNKGSPYVQGMNEVVGPIYYVFANHPDLKERSFAEADTFFCFNNLMAEIQCNFNRSLDQDFGIGEFQMVQMLGRLDPELLCHLNRLQLEPTYFAFRWITLLFSREFMLPDVLRLWDCIFADEHRFDLVLYICCSMLM
ncbi:unnamed protein product, partial [Mesocestoides corti]